jgi:UDP-glucose 4-epimerase
MIEDILRGAAITDCAWRAGPLRHFNPVGALAAVVIGEDPGIPDNLIPYVAQAAAGKLRESSVLG